MKIYYCILFIGCAVPSMYGMDMSCVTLYCNDGTNVSINRQCCDRYGLECAKGVSFLEVPFSNTSLCSFFEYCNKLKNGLIAHDVNKKKLINNLAIAHYFKSALVSAMSCTMLKDIMYKEFDASNTKPLNFYDDTLSGNALSYFISHLINKPHINFSINQQTAPLLGFKKIRELNAKKELIMSNNYYYAVGQRQADNTYKRVLIHLQHQTMPLSFDCYNACIKSIIPQSDNPYNFMALGTDTIFFFDKDNRSILFLPVSNNTIMSMDYNPRFVIDNALVPSWISLDNKGNLGRFCKTIGRDWHYIPCLANDTENSRFVDGHIKVSPQGNYTVVVCRYLSEFNTYFQTIKIYNKDYNAIYTINAPDTNSTIVDIAFNGMGEKFYCISDDGLLYTYDLSNLNVVRVEKIEYTPLIKAYANNYNDTFAVVRNNSFGVIKNGNNAHAKKFLLTCNGARLCAVDNNDYIIQLGKTIFSIDLTCLIDTLKNFTTQISSSELIAYMYLRYFNKSTHNNESLHKAQNIINHLDPAKKKLLDAFSFKEAEIYKL